MLAHGGSEALNFMKITFWGAAQTVTGSMHHVEAAGKRVRARQDRRTRIEAEAPLCERPILGVIRGMLTP